MKKKISLGIFTILLIGSAVVFANSGKSNNSNVFCPNRPDCVCPENTKQVSQVQNTDCDKTSCPNQPGCICSE